MRVSALGLVIMLAACGTGALAQERVSHGFIADAEGPADFIEAHERDRTWAAIDGERAKLALPKAGARPSFRWPLRPSRGYSDPLFSRVGGHVDHDAHFPDQLRDYSCGAKTYDRSDGYNHQGTDIVIVPDSWNLMLAGQIEIVAAAEGTIILKQDGNSDRSCARAIGSSWNAVYVQHDDGSIAWYGHMKTGSTTTKSVGARVAAGEYLGKVGSSGNSSGPHLHLEVYDANKRLVDPFAGACNAMNADSWWASQPAYASPAVMALVTASGSPTAFTCVDGDMQSPGDYHRKSAFARGGVAFFVASVRDLPAGERVRYVLRAPDGSVWSQVENSAAQQAFAGSTWWVSVQIPANAPLGSWMVEASLGASTMRAPFTVTANGAPIANYTDLWWNPGEPGWGVNLSHQGEKLFATWFTYDADGAGMWLVMSDSVPQAGAMVGTLYRTSGVPLEQIAGHPATSGAPAVVGSASFRFTDDEHLTMGYSVNGVAQSKSLVRQRFSTPASCMLTRGTRAYATNYQDLWWNPAEPGWGINLTHQGDVIFATWFTYGAGGRGVWYVASDARRQGTGEFRGRLYRTAGMPFDRVGAGPTAAVDVGEITLTFTDGEHGRFDYAVGGVSQSKSITRQVFAESAPLCK
jgi:murein DD-endopeptidase MepM/ murein hydrolase activator NlpD